MEDGSSGIDINPDSSADGAGNSKLRARALSTLVKRVCQNRHILFLSQSPDFLKPGLCYVQDILYLWTKF